MIRSVCIVTLCLSAVSYAEPSTNGKWPCVGNWKFIHSFPQQCRTCGWIQDGTKIYVGRITHSEQGTVPARVVAENGTATYFSHKHTNHYFAGTSLTYEILVDEGDFEYAWIRSYDGFYEKGSVSVGTLHNKDQAFVCRVWLNGELLLGHKYGYDKSCYSCSRMGTASINFDKYEILVARQKTQ